jgi:hypothetical protein
MTHPYGPALKGQIQDFIRHVAGAHDRRLRTVAELEAEIALGEALARTGMVPPRYELWGRLAEARAGVARAEGLLYALSGMRNDAELVLERRHFDELFTAAEIDWPGFKVLPWVVAAVCGWPAISPVNVGLLGERVGTACTGWSWHRTDNPDAFALVRDDGEEAYWATWVEDGDTLAWHVDRNDVAVWFQPVNPPAPIIHPKKEV